MSASAVALSTPRHRAGLALLLAVLGVPGVTIAWDLPAGGFWIGIPLAVHGDRLPEQATTDGAPSPNTQPRLRP